MTTNEIPGKPSIAETFAPGQTLAESLTLKQKLSAGDTGILWLAHDAESDRDIALLFLPGVLLGDARVMDELRAQVKLNRQLIHPHVLRTHDFIEEEGWAAISSDAVEAESLASLLAKKENGCFDAPEIKAWLATLCQALDDAHRAGLLHRDLVPQNILLAKSGELLIANFGISRIILDAMGRAQGAGKIDEHLASMSPQQLDGEHPARWDDIYALGILIYQLLTGKPPFHTGDILPQVRKTMPPSIADRRAEFGITGEPVPTAWEKVVSACLEKHTPQRPKSAREVGVKLGTEISLAQSAPARPAQIPARVEMKAPETTPQAPREIEETKKTAQPAEPAAPKEIEEAEETKKSSAPAGPAETEESKESLVEDIVWRKPAQHPQPALGGPPSFKHLLEKLPEEQEGKKESPVRKVLVLAGIVATVLGVYLWARGWPEPKPASPPPRPAVSATPEVSTPAPTVTPRPTPKIATVEPSPAAGMLPPAVPPENLLALDQARKAVEETQKAVQEKTQAMQQAESDAETTKSALNADAAALAVMKKATDDMANLRKRREDEAAQAIADADKATVDAGEAQKIASEKVRAAQDAAKAKEQIIAQFKEQEEAQQKADADLQALQKTAAEKQSAAEAAAKAEKDAQALLLSQQTLLKQAQDNISGQTPAATPAPQPTAVSVAIPAATPDPLIPISPEKSGSTSIENAEQTVLNQAMTKHNGTDVTPASATTPAATPAEPVTYVANPKSQIDQTLTNSLGMKFQPVGNVLFCIWLTRVEDFEAFAKATHFKGTSWLQPGFKQGHDHPVVFVTWNDAMAFCKWLTDKERSEGVLAPDQSYRLPTDLEWSKAVGLPAETGKTPDERDVGVRDVYPWGNEWPPPKGAGNYNGEETGSDVSIKDYDDGYVFTSPVGSFAANKYGLYDMGGNAWEWCMDWLNGAQKQKVLRGASWYSGDLQLTLLSSCRWQSAPDISSDDYGFRCVIATEGKTKR